MKDQEHDVIKEHLRRIGVVEEESVQAALDAHDAGVDVAGVIRYIKAGLPDWLALLRALHEKEHGKAAPKRGAAKEKKGDQA